MRKRFLIDGEDFTEAFTPVGYTVSYKKIRGPNSGYMMNGLYVDDVLTDDDGKEVNKAIVTAVCMPTNEDLLQRLLVKLAKTYISFTFFDPAIKNYRTTEGMPSEPTQKYRGTGTDLLEYWTGTVLTFTER